MSANVQMVTSHVWRSWGNETAYLRRVKHNKDVDVQMDEIFAKGRQLRRDAFKLSISLEIGIYV